MNLFFQIQNLQLWIFYIDSQEFLDTLDIFFYLFVYHIIKDNHFLYRFVICCIGYVSIESIDWILISSFELNTSLLISSVKTLFLSLLNLCFVFNFDLLFFMTSSWLFLRLYVLILFFYWYFILLPSSVAFK